MSRIAMIAAVVVVILGGAFWLGRSTPAPPEAGDPFAPVDVAALRQKPPTKERPKQQAETIRRQAEPVKRRIVRDLSGSGNAVRRDDVAPRPHAAAEPASDTPKEPSDLARDLEGQGKDFFGAQLEEENLTGANLEGANLSEANLRHAQLDDANLQDADLRAADLTGANLVGTDLSGAQLQGASLQETYIQANMRKADLRGADMRAAGLWGVHMNKADLRGANLQGATIKGDFMEADLRQVDMRWASMDGVNLHNANLEDAILLGATSLTCDSLTIARNWESSIRSPELACGAPLPPIPPEMMEE